ncbi:MAG: alpha/beta fold hydrolase [Hyphomonadaceae bacterium]|nr:alpha/beta fold hydrolase [Hyphomonadaceae bacterium]
MAAFILAHGAWHGAWCWDALTQELAARGGRGIAIDLPGHGANGAPGWRYTLEDYAQAVVDAVRAHPGAIPVGHSMGGIVIARAAELAPQLIPKLIFCCAFIPRRGDSLMSLGREAQTSGVPSVVIPDPIRGLARIRRDRAPAVFYNDCSEAAVAAAQARLQDQSLRPMFGGAQITPARFGHARRFYLACTEDRAIPHAFQQAMLARIPCEDVVTLNASHSPFVSQPAATADAFLRFARA